MGVSFDLFGTLVTVERPAGPATAVAEELEACDVTVPDDWRDAYTEVHYDVPPGRELSLPEHVSAALESRGIDVDDRAVWTAVTAVFDVPVRVRPGAREAVETARERGPIAVCSNCSVPGLVERTLERAGFDPSKFDAVVSSVDCGWRKPALEIFEVTADRLGVRVTDLVHVGDDPRTDGGIEDAGGTAVVLAGHDDPENRLSGDPSGPDAITLEEVPNRLAALAEGRT